MPRDRENEIGGVLFALRRRTGRNRLAAVGIDRERERLRGRIVIAGNGTRYEYQLPVVLARSPLICQLKPVKTRAAA